jgi:hypothetical protein
MPKRNKNTDNCCRKFLPEIQATENSINNVLNSRVISITINHGGKSSKGNLNPPG